jgi:hypothetical protein
LGTRTSVVLTTTGRQFAYYWSAPRSPVWQVALAPVFLGVALLILLLGALALALVLAVAILAVVGLTIASLFRPIVARARVGQRGMFHRQWLD